MVLALRDFPVVVGRVCKGRERGEEEGLLELLVPAPGRLFAADRTRISVSSTIPVCPLAPRWSITSARIHRRTFRLTHSLLGEQRPYLVDHTSDRRAVPAEPGGKYVVRCPVEKMDKHD